MRLLAALVAVLLLASPPVTFAALSCNQTATDSCNQVDTKSPFYQPKSLLAADGWVFSMFDTGYMARCNQGSNPGPCETFNRLSKVGGPMAILRPGVIITTSGNIMVRTCHSLIVL